MAEILYSKIYRIEKVTIFINRSICHEEKVKAVPDYQRPLMLRVVQISIISAVVVLTLLVSIWNAADLKRVLNRSTQQYLYDVATQTAREISETMQHKMEDLEVVADSVAKGLAGVSDEELAEFLARKADIMEFSTLLVIDRDGGMVSSGLHDDLEREEMQDILNLSVVKDAFEGKVGASYLEGQEIIYSVPVPSGERYRRQQSESGRKKRCRR